MIKEINILIAGVGGQGNILMSELLGEAAIHDGINVKGSEVLGIAQRGGAVNTMLRLGSAPQGPLIPQGKVDIMIGMEPVEALRNISYMAKTGWIIINTRKVIPVPVMLGEGTYPSLEEIVKKLEKNSSKIVTLDALQLAEEAGSGRAVNMVMLGATFGTGLLPIKTETIKAAIERRFRGQVKVSNIKAFDLGYQTSQQAAK